MHIFEVFTLWGVSEGHDKVKRSLRMCLFGIDKFARRFWRPQRWIAMPVHKRMCCFCWGLGKGAWRTLMGDGGYVWNTCIGTPHTPNTSLYIFHTYTIHTPHILHSIHIPHTYPIHIPHVIHHIPYTLHTYSIHIPYIQHTYARHTPYILLSHTYAMCIPHPGPYLRQEILKVAGSPWEAPAAHLRHTSRCLLDHFGPRALSEAGSLLAHCEFLGSSSLPPLCLFAGSFPLVKTVVWEKGCQISL